MTSIAGVAFGGPRWFSTFCICRGNGDPLSPDLLSPEEFSIEGSEGVMNAVKACQKVLEDKSQSNQALDSAMLTFPIALPYGYDETLRSKARHLYYINDHMIAYIYLHLRDAGSGRREGEACFIFLDLTPGQIAGKLSAYDPEADRVYGAGTSEWSGEDELTVEEVFDFMINPLLTLVRRVGSPIMLAGVGILWPEEAHLSMSRSAIESRFPGTAVRFLSLADLAKGTALAWIFRPGRA